MTLLENFSSLLFLLTFFSLLGLGVTNLKTAKNNLLLLPIFGYAAVVALSYFISANFKMSGASGVGWAILILVSSFLLRIRNFSTFLKEIHQNKYLYMFLAVITVPICSVILPALLIGFKYFYGYVNYDFFYNSQDSWYLVSHNVLQFSSLGLGATSNTGIVPLGWSAGFSGRIGAGILGAFFFKTFHWDVLQFNSLLLNTIVVMFALSISVLCKEFFKLSNKAILVATFFSVMSAGYVQAYCYYVLGQISVIPVFIVFCIYLKRFIDAVVNKDDITQLNKHVIVLGLLFNALFVIYAIISFFAVGLTVLSYFICLYREKQHSIFPLLRILIVSIILFCLAHIFMVHESIEILKSWMTLSSRVAGGNHTADSFMVFSEYTTEPFLSLFFGLTNYVSPTSIFGFLIKSNSIRIFILLVMGIGALLTTLAVVHRFVISKDNSPGSKAVIGALFGMVIVGVFAFFYTLSGYGMFKFQTWFMPILTPIYIYYIVKINTTFGYKILKASCAFILMLNLLTSLVYFTDFLAFNKYKHFLSAREVTRSTQIDDLVVKLQEHNITNASLFLTNGLEVAWVSEHIKHIKLGTVAHNLQPLVEKDFTASCSKHDNVDWIPSRYLIFYNPDFQQHSDIVDSPVGGNVIYKNNNYILLDSTALKTFMYIGEGSYPVEYTRKGDGSFPTKFRWVEKGLDVMIYSQEPKQVNLSLEITPGFVQSQTPSRKIIITTMKNQYEYLVDSKTKLTAKNIQLHKGLNCIEIQSPDNISPSPRNGAFFRSFIPLDPRRTNFAISNVSLQ